MSIRVGINGFGRIGRNIYRASLGDPEVEIVAVNDITDPKTLAHLLKYDSILGNLKNSVGHAKDCLQVDGQSIRVFAEKDPAKIDWDSVGAQIVVESTGLFTNASDARKHLRGGVKKVIISAPAKEEDLTLVLGVNDAAYKPAQHHIVSNASVVDLVVFVDKATTVDEVNAALRQAAEGPMKGILGFCTDELVSADFRGDEPSSIVDAPLTRVIGGTCLKVISWYDNEWGYSCRVRDLIKFMAAKG